MIDLRKRWLRRALLRTKRYKTHVFGDPCPRPPPSEQFHAYSMAADARHAWHRRDPMSGFAVVNFPHPGAEFFGCPA
jgi:hypothetical protein